MPAAPSLPEVIRRALDSRLGDVFTALPGRIQSYDASTQTADIALVTRRPVPTGTESEPVYEDLPVLPNVPIMFMRGSGGACAITCPLEAGDHVLVIFIMLSFAGWRRTGETSDPGDLRLHHPGNAVAFPVMAANAQTLDQAQINAMVIEAPEIRLGKTASELLALASKVMANFNDLKNAINNAIVVAQDGGASFKSTLMAALTAWPQQVKTSKTKAE